MRIPENWSAQEPECPWKPVHLLKPERKNKSQSRLMDIFLYTPVNSHPSHLDSVLIGLNIDKKEIEAEKKQGNPGNEKLPGPRQPEIQRGKSESPHPLIDV